MGPIVATDLLLADMDNAASISAIMHLVEVTNLRSLTLVKRWFKIKQLFLFEVLFYYNSSFHQRHNIQFLAFNF